jgi:hypothetical protein
VLGEVLAHCSSGCYACKAITAAPPMNPIYRITYQRPWGECVVNTAQFANQDDLRARFAKSYEGCELLKVEDVTKEFLPNG